MLVIWFYNARGKKSDMSSAMHRRGGLCSFDEKIGIILQKPGAGNLQARCPFDQLKRIAIKPGTVDLLDKAGEPLLPFPYGGNVGIAYLQEPEAATRLENAGELLKGEGLDFFGHDAAEKYRNDPVISG